MPELKGGTLDCSICPNSIDCSNIATAKKIIEQKLSDGGSPELMREYQDILTTLENLGYSFPNGHQNCQLTNLPELSQNLVDKLLEVLKQQYTPM